MPITFDLENLRKEHACVNYFETGLWDPRCEVSSRIALRCGFNKLYSIEIKQEWVDLGKEVFKEYIESGKYHLYLDDSTNMKQYVLTDDFKDKTMFYLDAHVDHHSIQNYKKKCPLFEELEAIKSMERNDHVIMVDDVRIITTAFPWGETSYGNIDFLQQIKDNIVTINKDYKFSIIDDVLLAYV
jgi:hypothetical protein